MIVECLAFSSISFSSFSYVMNTDVKNRIVNNYRFVYLSIIHKILNQCNNIDAVHR